MDNIELLKSTPDDQIEMMLMSMHMEKPDIGSGGGGSYVDTAAAMMSFSGGCGPYNLPNPPQQTSTISFTNINKNNNNCIQALPYSSNTFIPSYTNDEVINNNSNSNSNNDATKHTSMAAMREMIFRIAAMQPIYIDPEAVKPPKRRNVRISKDPQSVAARHRRERISERIRILQRLVPGGTKMDTASMLDEAIHYVKFLKTQVQSLEHHHHHRTMSSATSGLAFPVHFPLSNNTTSTAAAAVAPLNNHVDHFSDA